MFTEQLLRKGLRTRVFGNKIYAFDSVDSTNNCAKAVAGIGAAEGTVIITEQQTAGKGRLGRQWQAEPNQNLMFSLVLRPKITPESLNLLPLYVAVAVSEAIERATGLKTECKWPNDILYKGKKLAGILIEGSTKQNAVEYVVIGIGINVNQTKFEGELLVKASSLKLECQKEIDRVALFREVLTSLESGYKTDSSTGFQSVVPQWTSRSTMINRQVSVSQHGNIISGIVKGLSPDGGLILGINGSEQTVFAGDVTVLQT
jgi:BirA family transcriptional regulator, biotin operon repressor / biotin---[acetyl-CoA-carboxylase] ligase